jgi:hypothetical protein
MLSFKIPIIIIINIINIIIIVNKLNYNFYFYPIFPVDLLKLIKRWIKKNYDDKWIAGIIMVNYFLPNTTAFPQQNLN